MSLFDNPFENLPSIPTAGDLFQTPDISQAMQGVGDLAGQIANGVVESFVGGNLKKTYPSRDIVGSIVAIGTDKSFFFLDTEVPEELPLGGVQVRAVHQFAGGRRAIDTFGTQPRPLTFSGEIFSVRAKSFNFPDPVTRVARWYPETDETALERSELLDKFRMTGTPVKFRFHYMEFTCIVSDYLPTVHHDNHVTYTITLDIISDNRQDPNLKFREFNLVVNPFLPPTENLLNQYIRYAKEATLFLNSATVVMTAMQSLIDQLQADPSKVIWAGVSMVPGVQSTKDLLAAAQNALNAFLAFRDNHQQTVLDFENAKPYDSLDADAFTKYLIPQTALTSNLLDQVIKFLRDFQVTPMRPDLTILAVGPGQNAKASLDNMVKEMRRAVTPIRVPVLRIQDPDLYSLAVYYYDDIEKWQVIAAANGLSTPRPKGLYDLKIPDDNSGGASAIFGTVGLS